jgi:NADH-quinone oxidoreductase E subunit
VYDMEFQAMPWPVQDRRTSPPQPADAPQFTDDMKKHLAERILPRYPTKRAALLPALHMVQHHFGWISTRAMDQIAQFLGVSPAEVLDTATFYEEYWLKPKGKYLLQVCRSLACEICGSKRITEHLKKKLGVEVGQTTPDGRFTLVELECLGSCGTAPAMLCNEVLYEALTPDKLDQLLAALPADPHDLRDPSVTW